jgi:ATP:corrinoid adenosyltransferase
MSRPISVVKLVELMTEDARLAAQIAELQRKRTEARDQVVAEIQRRKLTEITGLGQVIELKQQKRRRPSTAAAKERLADKPELLARLLVEVVNGDELKRLLKDELLTQADVDFIAPEAPHGGHYPVLRAAPKGPRKAS